MPRAGRQRDSEAAQPLRVQSHRQAKKQTKGDSKYWNEDVSDSTEDSGSDEESVTTQALASAGSDDPDRTQSQRQAAERNADQKETVAAARAKHKSSATRPRRLEKLQQETLDLPKCPSRPLLVRLARTLDDMDHEDYEDLEDCLRNLPGEVSRHMSTAPVHKAVLQTIIDAVDALWGQDAVLRDRQWRRGLPRVQARAAIRLLQQGPNLVEAIRATFTPAPTCRLLALDGPVSELARALAFGALCGQYSFNLVVELCRSEYACTEATWLALFFDMEINRRLPGTQLKLKSCQKCGRCHSRVPQVLEMTIPASHRECSAEEEEPARFSIGALWRSTPAVLRPIRSLSDVCENHVFQMCFETVGDEIDAMFEQLLLLPPAVTARLMCRRIRYLKYLAAQHL